MVLEKFCQHEPKLRGLYTEAPGVVKISVALWLGQVVEWAAAFLLFVL
ncbi:hypothetical protein Pogu_2421 [Pyrobaculum oguniense TE7]|uniref:Uncharacterized protein n=1 Tax=Pyrobaculum oguniense (strain DSM 13380 / JCM 10595 / TE7) TaxID=698757 RepID=H6QDA5_PYROT|nr:hypothetical protein Pogu_2421 [Pyrobaculum oguniense TE7]